MLAHRQDEHKERQSLHVPPFDLSPFPSAAEILNGSDASEPQVPQSADTQRRTTSPALVCRSTQVTSGSKSVLSAQLIEPKGASAGDRTSLDETKDATILHRRNRISIVEFASTSIPQPPANGVVMNKQVQRTLSDRHRLNTLKSVQRLHELDSFRRAARDFQTSEDCAPGDVHKLLHLFILRRPLLWRAFVSTFIFQRLAELKRMLSSSPCKHVIVR